MEIRDILNSYSPLNNDQSVNNNSPVANNNQAVNKNESAVSKDKIQISDEARKLQGSSSSATKDLTVIQEKIKNNFYNSPEVINHTATEILKEFAN
jgi:hypothetical protein